ncbi:MAG: adenylate/guanylate cyclase domain-containing protein [Planctomycetota bacterium]
MTNEFHDLILAYSRQSDGGGRKNIEQQLWEKYGASKAVLVLDMSGFSLLTQRYGIVHYLAMIKRMQLTVSPIIDSHRGAVVKFEADNCFSVFDDVLSATRAAVSINVAFNAANLITSDEQDIHVSIGIDYGKILMVKDDLFGHAVNRASKLGEDIAERGEILVVKDAFDTVGADAQIRTRPMDFNISGLNIQAVSVLL